MKTKQRLWIFFALLGIIHRSAAQLIIFDCPFGWVEFTDSCYRFVRDPTRSIDGFKQDCQSDGAFGLTINSEAEHVFVQNTLEIVDAAQLKQSWWTSGRRVAENSMDFYWEGDGTKIESYVYWLDDSIPTDFDKDYILYHFDGYRWGWILGTGEEEHPYICEISKEDIYKISQEERGPDYGVDNPDPSTIERGPRFTVQPEDTVYETDSIIGFTTLESLADAFPAASYSWTRERAGDLVDIDPVDDSRYTLINGKLIIHEPHADTEDDGKYQCRAENKFGAIMSNNVTLNFGYLQDFPKSPRTPVEALAYGYASIECSPPAHFPDILYGWYKDFPHNFVRPEFKPYIFISHDGRLYFSEVTTDDIGNYYCVVHKPWQALSGGKISMPTELRVNEGSPGIYEPSIGSGFPLIFPSSPKVGDTVRIECWASGTSRFSPLIYDWTKVIMDGNQVGQSLQLPNQARLEDHNRVLIIPNAQLYDAGTYRCRVRRMHGLSASATIALHLQALPYYTLPLRDQFADVGTDLRWRCEAGGIPAPQYFWRKNGELLINETIPSEDRDRVTVSNNVLTIRELDGDRDDGMYQCEAVNSLGTRASTAQLKVLSFPPNFKKYGLRPNQLATVEGNTTLFCRPEAAPYPEFDDIIWYKNGNPLNPGTDDDSRVRKMPNGNLFIKDLSQSDSGVYQCRVSNELGEARTTGNLTILDTITITQPPLPSYAINVNRTTFLHCMASHDPKLDVTYVWYHGNMLIEFERVYRLAETRYEVWYNPHFKRGSGLYIGGLYIMRAQFEHTGEYTCIVESSSGKTTFRTVLQVIGPPSEPAGVFIASETVTTSSVVVQWKASGTSTRPIVSYVLEALNYWEGFWKIIKTNIVVEEDNTETMRMNVTDLRPNSRYQLRFRAENALGTSIPSLPSPEFTTFAVKPDKEPTEVGGGGGRVGDLTITWKPLPEWEHNGPGIGYRIYWKMLGDENWKEIKDQDGNHARFVDLVGEVNFYRQYEVAVQAYNDIGFGPMSETVTIRSAMSLPTVIAQNVRAQPYNATACLVHWEPVEDSREHIKGKLGGYRISFWKECCETEDMAPRTTINGQASEGLVIGLYPDTPYFFDVMVWNEAGNGPKSQYFIQRTLRSAPINMPVEVTVSRESSTSIHVTWRGVSTAQQEEPLEGYKVRIWSDGEHMKVGKDYDAEKETDLHIDDLRSDVMYKLRVYGYSRGGMGTMSSPAAKFMLGAASLTQISTLAVATSLLLSVVCTHLLH